MEHALSTQELENIISNDDVLAPQFQGVFAANKIPCNNPSGKFFIINTAPSFHKGEHWVSIYFPVNSQAEFFDSLGKCPSFYSNYILDFLIENSSNGFVYNHKRIQKPFSSSCGLYCLYFAYFRCRNVSFQNILNVFSSSNSVGNDI